MFTIRDCRLYRIGRSALQRGLLKSATYVDRKIFRSIERFQTTKVGFVNVAPEQRRKATSVASAHDLDESVTLAPSVNELWHKNLSDETWLNGPRDMDWFTGKAPIFGACPGVGEDGIIRSLPLPNLSKVTRQGTQDYFDNTWALFETLFAGLNGETPFYSPPQHGLRHPQIFYYGHSTCLYVNKLQVAGILDGPVDSYLESVLEVGVDEMVWDDMHTFDDVWPTVQQVREYRKKVYKIISDVIASHPELDDNGGQNPVTVTKDHACWALFMGFEHERIHLETSSVLFREMPVSYVQVPREWPTPYRQPSPARDSKPEEGVHYPVNEMLPVAGGEVTLGKPTDHPSYGWDNEYGTRKVKVPPFSASKFKVTNGEFYQFVKDGGYQNEKYWSISGWQWRNFRNAKWPFFWEQNGPQGSLRFKLRTVLEITDMPWANPVEVNYFEARAYGSWKAEKNGLTAYRVLTEAEHHMIRPSVTSLDNVRKNCQDDRVMYAQGENFVVKDTNSNSNSNLAWGSTIPVDSLLPSETGHYDTMGNTWDWCEDDFNPLEGFELHPYYTDFSSPCFDGQHNMILGGSFISTGQLASTFARFHFRPHFLQHSGFRLVSSADKPPATYLKDDTKAGSDNVYETTELVNQYLGFHFAQESGKTEGISAILPHANSPEHALRFPQRCAELLVKLRPLRSNGRVLDVGCSVGGTSFELATQFEEVVGFDFSQAFVDAAKEMQSEAQMKFNLSIEAELSETVTAVHEAHVDAAARKRITFQVGDACHMDKIDGTFDGAVVANLLCRVPEPLAVLDGLTNKINQGGVVVMATPFSWLKQYTNKEKWLGGYLDSAGTPVHSKDRLQIEMEARGFTQIHSEQMVALIREHQRKYQYIVSQATGWRKL